MADCDDSPYRPYVLWFETLPSGDTAQVYLWPHPNSCGVIAHWNGQVRREETHASLAGAARRGWEWRERVPNLTGIGPHELGDVSMPWA